MTKNELNIGDKVVAKRYYDIDVNGYSTTIPIGEVGVIEDVYDEELLVSFSNYGVTLIRPTAEFEPIQPLDRRTAFLTELQALLRKYDATIYGGLSETHNDDVIFVSIGNDDIAYRNGYGEEYANITADNIMNFNKE